ncbi:hypothetical protein M758_9G091500 [Ceratodon purpureus]|nr:hypothetical protein M758_9G091500 [Ceratodon purpureus]
MLDIEIVPAVARGKGRRRRGYMQLRPAPVDDNKVMIGETDMPQALQSHAVRAASEALDMHEGTDYKDVAYYIKNQFDKEYGTGWQCITGVSFGSYVTHSSGSFIHFCLGRLAIMLFKAAC